MDKSTINKWSFSIVMLNYQRVLYVRRHFSFLPFVDQKADCSASNQLPIYGIQPYVESNAYFTTAGLYAT